MKTIRWSKRGLIYVPDRRLKWAHSHAQIPTAAGVKDGRVRILFSSRDAQNRSFIARLDLNAEALSEVLNVQEEPLLPLGSLGAFDDCGMMPSSVVEHNGLHYLYYIGWNVRNTVPYHNSVGLAISEDGGETYRRLYEGPIMDRTASEPYFCATTCVRIENGIWRNWYLSCTEWRKIGDTMEPRYHLKYAESNDGVNWRRHGQIAIDYANDMEGGIVRATVRKEREGYRMWYCYRSIEHYREDPARSYRIGYAESADGLKWRRLDHMAGIDVSTSGWDASMLAYPELVEVNGKNYLFYNGNGFGESGFGYAEEFIE